MDDVISIHDQAVQLLHDADFMSVHSLHSVQTIGILLQVSHNLGKSDLVSVLLSCAIRIAQSLSLHRLGADKFPDVDDDSPTKHVSRTLVDREVKKRAWWSLVRQDWLQIPFQNTYSIHSTQFNTPMPLNCHEDTELMVVDGKVLDYPKETYTQTSYTNILNQGKAPYPIVV